MRNKTLVPLIASLMLLGCASGPPPTPTPIPEPKDKAPASLTQDCPDLPPPESGKKTALLNNHVQVAKQYHKCRERHRGLVEWVEKKQ